MSQSIPKKYIIIFGSLFVILFVGLSAFVAYATYGVDPISMSFKKLYPAALVGSHPVSIADAENFINLAHKMDSTIPASEVYKMLLAREKSEQILGDLGVEIPSDALTDEVNYYEQASTDAFAQFVATYFGGSEKLFEQTIVYPEVTEAYLRMKYNSDFAANSDAYKEALDIKNRLSAGEKFEDLAKTSSDDKQSAQFGGDLGFYAHGEILPELEKAIAVAKQGEPSDIIVTRQGYEIVLPLEVSVVDGVKKWHAKHVLIETSGFDQWLTNQTRNVSVKTFKTY